MRTPSQFQLLPKGVMHSRIFYPGLEFLYSGEAHDAACVISIQLLPKGVMHSRIFYPGLEFLYSGEAHDAACVISIQLLPKGVMHSRIFYPGLEFLHIVCRRKTVQKRRSYCQYMLLVLTH